MRRMGLLLPLAAMLATAPAWADDRVPPVGDALTRKECGHCHMAFQPAFLPARSWNRLMDGLAGHFGDDASLAPDKARHIRDWLTANAGDRTGTGRKYLRRLDTGATPLRITETPSFLREHRFPDSVWKRPEILTRSNCPACHKGAEHGWYDDD